MKNDIYITAKTLGLNKKEVDKIITSSNKQEKADCPVEIYKAGNKYGTVGSSDLYKAGTDYGTIGVSDIYKAGTAYGTVSPKEIYKAGTIYGTISCKDF